MTRHPMRVISTVVGFSFTLVLVGCDYWPPALQAEIEQLRSETQTLTIEKTQLQAQVTDLSKTKQELQESPVFPHVTHGGEGGHGLKIGLMIFSVCVAAAGIAVAYMMYVKDTNIPNRIAERFKGLLACS